MNCKYCHGLTLEKLASPEGYLHSPSRSSLIRSAQRCPFCSILFRKDRSRHSSQLKLSIEPFSHSDPRMCLKLSHLGKNSQDQLAFFLYTSQGDSIWVTHKEKNTKPDQVTPQLKSMLPQRGIFRIHGQRRLSNWPPIGSRSVKMIMHAQLISR